MVTAPEALRLANALDKAPYACGCTNDAASELRRLHLVNADLLQALKMLLEDAEPCLCAPDDDHCPLQRARAAIFKATGEKV